MAIAKLSIDIEARLANFERDLGKISTAAESTANRIKTSFAGVGAIVGSAFGALLAAGAVQQFQGLVNSLDQMAESAERIGLTTEALSGLAYAGKMSGLELDDMTLALTKLSGKMQDAASGSKEAKALFKDLGINVKDASGNLKTADAIFAEVAEKFAGLEDGAAKTALAVDMFGKSGAKMVPLLNGGAQGLKDMTDEAERLGGILDGKLAKQAADFNDNLDKLSTLSASAGKSIASGLLPWLNEAAESFLIATKHSNGFWDTLNKKIPGLQSVDVSKELKIARAELETLEKDKARWLKNGNSLADTKIESMIASANQKLDYYKELQRNAALADNEGNYGNEGRGATGKAKEKVVRSPTDTPDKPKTPKGPKAAKETVEASPEATAYGKAMESLDKITSDAEKSQIKLTKSQSALLDVMSDAKWADMPESWKQTAIAQFETAQAAEKAADSTKRLNDMLGATESAGIEKARSDMLLLVAALNKGTIGEQQFSEAATARLDLAAKKTEEVTSEMDEFAKSAARNMQSSFADFLFDPFADGTKSMGENFANSLKRMLAEAASAKIMNALVGDGKSEKGLVGSIDWSKLFSGFGSSSSGATGLASLQASGVQASFDVGTDYVPYDMVAKVHKGERITPAKFNPANGGGAVSVQINNYSGQSVQQKEVPDGRGGRRIEVTVGDMVAAEMRRSGSAANKALSQPRMVSR